MTNGLLFAIIVCVVLYFIFGAIIVQKMYGQDIKTADVSENKNNSEILIGVIIMTILWPITLVIGLDRIIKSK